jgi:hypothetical protein
MKPQVPTTSTPHDFETRTRILSRDGVHWAVREEPWPTVDRRASRCLIFDGVNVVRRVRNYPPNWFTLSDDALYSLTTAF